MLKRSQAFTAVAVLFVLTSLAHSAVPQLIPYQGRLTNSVGDPVPDGAQLVRFIVYDAAVGGAVLWNSGLQNVTTTNGLFSYDLGSSAVPFPDNLFSDTVRYLGVSVGADPEITPRTRFESSAYTYQALRSDSAGFAAQASNADLLDGFNSSDFVKIVGGVMTGSLGFSNGSYPMNYIYQSGVINATRAIVAHSPTFPGYGIFYNDTLDEISFSGGGGTALTLIPSSSGDNSVRMTDNAINADEILNEPGIASQENSSALTLSNTAMQDVETVDITIPTSGYILVSGRCYLESFGSVFGNLMFTQIDETSGGAILAPYYTTCGQDQYANTSRHSYNAFATRTYFKSAGTYTFRLEAAQNSGAHTGTALNGHLTALFIPTSYGPTVASVGFATEGSIPMQAIAQRDPSVAGNVQQVDLRALELAAKEARIKALEAELELRRAQAGIQQASGAQD